jgi:cytochrome c oxidase subunit 4
MKASQRRLAGVWLALMTLLALTCASAYVPMGVWNAVANLAIALAKALLVVYFFMHLARGTAAHRLVAASALFTLALLVGLSMADYTTRTRYAAPWQAPSSAR